MLTETWERKLMLVVLAIIAAELILLINLLR